VPLAPYVAGAAAAVTGGDQTSVPGHEGWIAKAFGAGLTVGAGPEAIAVESHGEILRCLNVLGACSARWVGQERADCSEREVNPAAGATTSTFPFGAPGPYPIAVRTHQALPIPPRAEVILRAAYGSIGSVILMMSPPPSRARASMDPWNRSTTRRQTASPIPLPEMPAVLGDR